MRRLVLPAFAILAPVLAGMLLFVTRGVPPLRRDQAPAPAWLAQEATGVAPRRYVDRGGRDWWRLDLADGAGFRIAPPADAFPAGCEVAWFVRRGVPLRLCPDSDAAPLPAPDRVRPDKILFHRISAESLRAGAVVSVPPEGPRESFFLMFRPARVADTEAGYRTAVAWGGARGRSGLAVLSIGFAALFALAAMLYRAGGRRTAGIAALAAAFALCALWFDSPVWARECRIDKGDDSYYLAYAQNLANHGEFFRFPARIGFGGREVDHAHGMPGTALMLSPPLLARALPGGAARRGGPITPDELRAMRATSALYAFGAGVLLFLTLRRRDGGDAPPSVWDVALPALLLWGTSLPRWAFVRSIFTHPAELFLLCLALWLAAESAPRRALLRECLLAAVVGLLLLVRGEYLLVCPVFLLLPRRTEGGLAPATFLRRHGLPLLILAIFGLVYANWASHIATGYGRPADAGLPVEAGLMAVVARIARNAAILLRSFVQNGAILPVAAVLALAAPFAPAFRSRAAALPVRAAPFAILAALLFLLNSAFTPPLGDEFGHRYALKLYPFALLWLGVVLTGPRPATVSGRVARAALGTFPAMALAANLRLLLRIGGTDLGQNFSMLTNQQLATLPPSGPAALNLRVALWLLLAAWAGVLFVALARRATPSRLLQRLR